MDFLEAIYIILYYHKQQGLDEERISAVLQSYRITLPNQLIRRVIGTLYHIHNGFVYSVEWAMSGYQFIVDRSAAGDTNWVICDELFRFGYLWDHSLVCQIIFVHHSWREMGNGGSG
ncbi:hypothetical protein MMC07_001738 [Pseudocyphellaria aurata]|nr:hypothetical protein [Pseudocyphellaria aurata]